MLGLFAPRRERGKKKKIEEKKKGATAKCNGRVTNGSHHQFGNSNQKFPREHGSAFLVGFADAPRFIRGRALLGILVRDGSPERPCRVVFQPLGRTDRWDGGTARNHDSQRIIPRRERRERRGSLER